MVGGTEGDGFETGWVVANPTMIGGVKPGERRLLEFGFSRGDV
jgi:hypothetical protein